MLFSENKVKIHDFFLIHLSRLLLRQAVQRQGKKTLSGPHVLCRVEYLSGFLRGKNCHGYSHFSGSEQGLHQQISCWLQGIVDYILNDICECNGCV